MESGRIAQIGSPEAVYRDPQSSYVLRFLGTTNRFEGTAKSGHKGATLEISAGFSFPIPDGALASGKPAAIDIRAEDITLSPAPSAIHRDGPGRVALRTFLGSHERFVVEWEGREIIVDLPAQAELASPALRENDAVYLDFDPVLGRMAKEQ